MEQKITSLDQLKQYAQGQVIELPAFSEDQPFVARIKRPSMLALAKANKIPNSLLLTANNLFAGAGVDKKKPEALKDVFSVLDVICEACFVEPTYQELREAGVELTDEQYMFLFNYTQRGVRALDNFRPKSPNYQPDKTGEEV